MKTEKLLNEKGEVKAYYCGKCGKIYSKEDTANRCCICITCGKEIDHKFSNLDCNACRTQASINREKDQTARAVELKEIPDCECFVLQDEEYLYGPDGVTDYLCDLEGDDIPEWVFPCKKAPFHLDIADLVSNHAYENHHEDYEFIDLDGLINFFEEWCKKQPVSYNPDMKQKISSKLFLMEE